MVQELGFKSEIIPLRKVPIKVYVDNEIKNISSQLNIFSLLFHGLRVFFSSQEGRSVKDYYAPIVGRGNYNHLFSNLFRAVIVQPAHDYPAKLFLKRRKNRDKSVPYKFNFKNGLQSFLKQIVTQNQLEIDFEVIVQTIVKENGIYKVLTNDGKEYFAKNIGLGMEPPTAAKIIEGIDKDVSDYLKSIPTFQSESHNVMVRKEAVSLEQMSFLISLNDQFMSVVTRDVYEHPEYRAFTFHFEKGQYDEVQRVAYICDILQIKKEDILSQAFMRHTLPSLKVNHSDNIHSVEKRQTETSLFILGNYFYGLSIEDCVNRSLDEFSRYKVVNELEVDSANE